jgi:hypothetical protein
MKLGAGHYLICKDPAACNSTIAAQVGMRSVKGIKPETVSKIRDKLTELADGILTIPEDFVDVLLREIEKLKTENDALRAERRKQSWLQIMSVEDWEAYRTSGFFAEAAALFGMTADRLFGATIDETFSATIIGPNLRT